jgi:hypothetical protein
MKETRWWPGSRAVPCLLLAVVSAASVGLNTDLHAPPRFDGAGYALLAEALASGRGYREISEPTAPRHAHFPPGYPVALALLWSITGRSVEAAHVFSVCCTVGAVLLAWRWFRTIYRPRTAFVLGLALALNWSWGRIGGSIQSEPFYFVWEIGAVLATVRALRRGSVLSGIGLGLVLAGCMLVRHVGACLFAAVMIDLSMRRRWRPLWPMMLTVTALVVPWAGWLASVRHNTQAELLVQGNLATRIGGQAVFYLQRLPDQITGPVVEVATVFQRSPLIVIASNLWAVAATSILIWGWVSSLHTRRRLAGLVGFTTLALLLVWPFTEAGRLLIPILPFVLVGATEGLARLLAWSAIKRPRLWAVLVVFLVSVPYALYAIVSDRALAQRQTHTEFDAACQWIANRAEHPGLVMALRPGEVFWQTRRHAVAPDSSDPAAIADRVDRLGIAYLLIGEDRYKNASQNPLGVFVSRYPDRVSLVWSSGPAAASIQIWEIVR